MKYYCTFISGKTTTDEIAVIRLSQTDMKIHFQSWLFHLAIKNKLFANERYNCFRQVY